MTGVICVRIIVRPRETMIFIRNPIGLNHWPFLYNNIPKKNNDILIYIGYVSSNRKKKKQTNTRTHARTKSLSLKSTGVNTPGRIPLGRRTNFRDDVRN